MRTFVLLAGLGLCGWGLLGCQQSGAALPSVQSFDSAGTRLYYFEQGQGEPVVLIHGWLSSAGVNWALPGLSEALAENFRVIALDVRGHGLSDKPTDEAAYGPQLVEDVARLLDHLEIEQAHLVGYSMGGIIAARFVVDHPDRAISCTLGGMGWLQEGGLGQWAFAQIGRNDPDRAAHVVCGRSLARLALTRDELAGIETPVQVVVGADDRLIQRLYVEPLAAARPDWPIVEIPDAGHLTCFLQPQFKAALLQWLTAQHRE